MNRVRVFTLLVATSISLMSLVLPARATLLPPFELYTVPVGSAPGAIVHSPLTARVFVGNTGSGTVTMIDETTAFNGNLIATFVIPQCTGPTGPWGLAVNPNTDILYVACYSANTLVSVDGTTGVIIKSVPTGGGPFEPESGLGSGVQRRQPRIGGRRRER